MQDLLDKYTPPFDLTSDLLFVMAFCPTAPLAHEFPAQPFLSFRGKTPLLMWFSRVREIRYESSAGVQKTLGDEDELLYYELNVVALLRERSFFVPGIYATGPLTIQVGHRYGMPKQPTRMTMQVQGKRVTSKVQEDEATKNTEVQALLLNQGYFIGSLLSRFWPRQIWAARFPVGSTLRPVIKQTPSVRVAWIRAGCLALNVPWLPQPVSLLPLGIYLADQRMQLPAP